MEFCAHGELTNHVNASLESGLREAFIDQLAIGLQHMHHLNVVHRDIKAENILITEIRGRKMIRYIDFGLAIEIAPGSKIMDRKRIGTPGYMSPEVVLGYVCFSPPISP